MTEATSKDFSETNKSSPSKFRRPSQLQLDSPFSKSASNTPMSLVVDGSEREVGSFYDFASKDNHRSSSRCSSSDTSKESLFSPATIGRSRSMSSGSGSRKSPRFFEMMSSPYLSLSSSISSSQLFSPLTVVQEEVKESGTCSALSKTLNVWHINDPSASEITEEVVEEGPLPSFFSPTSDSCWSQPRRDRAGSYCDEYDVPLSCSSKLSNYENKTECADESDMDTALNCGSYFKNGEVTIHQPSSKTSSAQELTSPTSIQENNEAMQTDQPLEGTKVIHFQPHVFSPLPSSTLSMVPDLPLPPPPPPASFSFVQPPQAGNRRASKATRPNKGFIRATSLDFDNSNTFSSSSTSSSPTKLNFQKHHNLNKSSTAKPRHSSISGKLTRNKTEPCRPLPAPETPPEMERCFSQVDGYAPSNNPRGPNPFNTPQGALSCKTSVQSGNDWCETEASPDEDLEIFQKLFNSEREAPCVTESSSMTRGIFSSISSAFGLKSGPFCSMKK